MRDEMVAVANAALGRGVNPALLVVYKKVEASVESRPKIKF